MRSYPVDPYIASCLRLYGKNICPKKLCLICARYTQLLVLSIYEINRIITNYASMLKNFDIDKKCHSGLFLKKQITRVKVRISIILYLIT